MKRLLLIISVLLFINIAKAQEKKDTLTYFSISDTQRKIWSDLENKWREDYFNPFLKKHKLKTTCAHCYSIHFEVIFTTNEAGQSIIGLKSNYVCGRKFTKKQETELISALQKIVFPAEFYNGIFLFRIGRTLKC